MLLTAIAGRIMFFLCFWGKKLKKGRKMVQDFAKKKILKFAVEGFIPRKKHGSIRLRIK